MLDDLPIKNLIPSTQELQVLQSIARNAYSSGLYAGIGNEQKILMILLAARELGITPMLALNGGLWNIQGRIEISARLMNFMIRKAGHHIVIKEINQQKCILEGKRVDTGDSFTVQFTIEEAHKAGLSSREIWRKYTEDMLYARAMSRLARRLFPDVIGTAYVEGELRRVKQEVIHVLPLEDASTSKLSEEERKALAKRREFPDIELRLEYFFTLHPQEDPHQILAYFELCAQHWKSSKSYVLEKYQDRQKFLHDFSAWKAKQNILC